MCQWMSNLWWGRNKGSSSYLREIRKWDVSNKSLSCYLTKSDDNQWRMIDGERQGKTMKDEWVIMSDNEWDKRRGNDEEWRLLMTPDDKEWDMMRDDRWQVWLYRMTEIRDGPVIWGRMMMMNEGWVMIRDKEEWLYRTFHHEKGYWLFMVIYLFLCLNSI